MTKIDLTPSVLGAVYAALATEQYTLAGTLLRDGPSPDGITFHRSA